MVNAPLKALRLPKALKEQVDELNSRVPAIHRTAKDIDALLNSLRAISQVLPLPEKSGTIP